MTRSLAGFYRRLLGIAAIILVAVVPALAQPCQNILAHVVSTSPAADPADSVIKICQGTTVTFTGSATFSNSGAGATYQWKLNNTTILNGTTVSQNFPVEGVYVIDFVVTDANGCVNKNCDSRRVIYVSTTPHFDQTIHPDTVCLHQTALIQGRVTPIEGIYDCAPPIADTTFLPDGTGVSYTTDINVACFTPCDTVQTAADIAGICMTMEHSYIGDLIVSITCPNGQNALLFNGNGATALGTYLGEPNDGGCPTAGDNVPGVGYNYCFSSTAALGTFVQECNNGNWVPNVGCPASNSMAPGNYQPQASFNNLIGCPMNGNWTITVTDDQGSDNGYIFSWGIEFRQGLGNYSFLPDYPQQHWAANVDIVGSSNGGKDITIRPETNGNALHCYTFQVVDSFNCPYDTNICVYVVDPGNPGEDTTVKICLNQDPVNVFEMLGGNPEPGGTWSGSVVTPAGVFDPSAAGIGFHDVVYTQRKWNCDTTATVTFEVVNNVNIDFSFALSPACDQDTVRFTNLSDTGRYWWNFGDGTLPEDTVRHPTHIYQDQDVYLVRLTVKNSDGCIDSVIKPVNILHPLVAAFNNDIDSVCQTAGTPVVFNDASTGAVTGWRWDFGDGGTSTAKNPSHVYSLYGNHQVRLVINDAIPCYDTAYTYVYVDSLPYLEVVTDRHAICAGEKVNFTADYLFTAQSIDWNFGDGIHWKQPNGTSHNYEQPGTYFTTVTADFPVCADLTFTDSVVVNSLPVVYLGPDSMLCLDGNSITVTDQHNINDPAVSWLWNTGATTPSIQIVHPGTYTVTATRNDCATSEHIVVNKDCYTDIPNAFSPNGDGQNDYFYPRQLLSQGVAGFTMAVYNRWGQKVFETSNTNGRGWDGRFNGKDQPMGVYLYQIKAIMKNGRVEDYTGNVTLIR